MMEGEKIESHQKGFLKLKYFSPLEILTSPFIWRDYWSFSFSSFLYICSVYWGLEGFDDIWGENHFFKNFFSNGLTWNGMVMSMDIPTVDEYSGMELCTPIWLIHDYGDGGVVDTSAVDAYSGVEVCTPIFLGEATK
jgi:hypothetical protein